MNDRCETESSSVNSRQVLVSTDDAEWRRVSVQLKAGVNVLSWQVWSWDSQHRVSSINSNTAVKIRLIEIHGQ